MDKELKLLKAAIRREADKLICEAHPGVCALRDANYSRLEELVISEVLNSQKEKGISIQTILAGLEGDF